MPAPATPTTEINASTLPQSSRPATVPDSLMAAITAEASKNAPQGADTPEPSPEATPPKKEAATPKAAQAEAIKPATTAAEPAKPAASTPATPPADEPKGIKQVREALQRAQEKIKQHEGSLTTTAKERAEAFQKAADLELKLAKMTEELEKDYKPRVARLAEVEKKLQEKEERLRIKAYQETDEFHDRYIKPLTTAQQEAQELLSELIVNNDDGSARAATQDDFNEVLSAPSLNQAAEIAQKKFGPLAAQSVVNLRSRMRSLDKQRQEAIKNSALAAVEYEKQMMARQATDIQRRTEFFRQQVQKHMEAEADIFSPPEGDLDAIATLTQAAQFADVLLNKPPEMPEEQFLSKVAEGRTRIMKSFVHEKSIAKLKAENAALQERLKAYEGSEPDVETRTGGTTSKAQTPQDKLLAAALSAAGRH